MISKNKEKKFKNYRYKAKGDWDYIKLPITKTEVDGLREEATKIFKKDVGDLGWRSCWICNGAHTRFLKGSWGKWVLNCFECGRFFYKGVDITIY
jgi:hypothetical protein